MGIVGADVGWPEGRPDGWFDGCVVGCPDGWPEGTVVGWLDGSIAIVGTPDG